MTLRNANGRHGFSIIELLVAVIIIGILVTIIVPRLSDRSEQAKIARTNQDLELIQKALEQTVVDSSYMVRLYVLDDVNANGDGGNTFPNSNADIIDAFEDEAGQSVYNVGSGPQIFIKPDLTTFALASDRILSTSAAAAVFDRLSFDSGGEWGGPYLTYQVDNNGGNNGQRTYIGDDAWGGDYMFFVPEGLIDDVYDRSTGTFGTGQVVATKSFNGVVYDCTVFDRFVILSLGPNGVPGNGTNAPGDGFGRGDDLFRAF